MLMPRESFTDRMRRHMTERKAAKLAAAPKKRVRSEDKERERLDAADARTVVDELAAIDAHAAVLRKQLQKRSGGPVVFGDFADERRREMERELSAIAVLRREVEDDQVPIMRDRDGVPLSPRLRAYRRMRTKEIAEQCWKQSQRAESAGDYRRARRCRLDSLRARHLAEHEMKLRPTLRGYTS